MKYLRIINNMNYIDIKKGTIIKYSRIDDDYFIIDSNLFETNNITPKEKNTISIGIPIEYGVDVTRIYKLKRLIEKNNKK